MEEQIESLRKLVDEADEEKKMVLVGIDLIRYLLSVYRTADNKYSAGYSEGYSEGYAIGYELEKEE
jgi:hypothetical protein